jgi:hypothetical protein
MTDIAKCEGIECDKKHLCYRYTCPSDTYQAYFRPPIPEICGYFIDNRERSNEPAERKSLRTDARKEIPMSDISSNEIENIT